MKWELEEVCASCSPGKKRVEWEEAEGTKDNNSIIQTLSKASSGSNSSLFPLHSTFLTLFLSFNPEEHTTPKYGTPKYGTLAY